MRERPRYTPEPTKGEDPKVTAARVFAWMVFQLTPEQRSRWLESISGKKIPEVPVVGGHPSWLKAMIKLADGDDNAIVGVRLDHPGMSWESFKWGNLEFTPRITNNGEDLDFKITNSGSTRRTFSIKLQNIYQDEETETIAEGAVDEESDMEGVVPLPRLVEGVPSVLVFLREDRIAKPRSPMR